MLVENTWSRVKIKSKHTNFKIIHKLRAITVNKGRIHMVSNPYGIREIF